MAGDYSRFSFRPERRVASVTMQQGRVQLDADWNEQGEVMDRRVRNLARDVWGMAWVGKLSTPDAFKLTPAAGPDLAIGTGRLYAHGLAPEVLPGEAPTYRTQPFLPLPPPIAQGRGVVYLDVFERELTWVEEPALLEKALHGVETAARRQVAWQVRLHATQDARCGIDLDAIFPPSAARLSTAATAIPKSDDPCILSPTGGYRGLENRLYRVQIHVPGSLGTAKFKWSRENASIVSPVETIATSGTKSEVKVLRIGRDPVLRFSAGDWIEITDDRRELMGTAGDMARVESVDETTRTLLLDRVVPDPAKTPFGPMPDDPFERHTRVIRWDQSLERHGNAVDANGLMTTGPGPIALEDGVQALFATEPATGSMLVDDHWSFEARTADGSVRTLAKAPPDGVRHVRVPLAVYSAGAAGITIVQDCRNLVPGDGGGTEPPPPPTGDACDCCTLCVGEGGDVPTLRDAVGMLETVAPNAETPVRLCLARGDHLVEDDLVIARPNVLVIGCFPRSRLIVRGGGLRFLGSRSGLVDVVVRGAAEPGVVVMAGTEQGTDQIVAGCRFEVDREVPAAILADAARRLRIEDNEVTGAGIGIRGPADGVRIEGNRIERIARSGITLETGGVPSIVGAGGGPARIEILRNILDDGLGAGIEAGGDGVVDGLTVIGNTITMWRGEALAFGKAAGGIVVNAVQDLVVQDNRIERNGKDAEQDCAGVRVFAARGITIERNRIVGNGRRDAPRFTVQGGIVIDHVRPPVDPDTGGRSAYGPALVVHGNVVSAPTGHALYARGRGDIRVQDNTLVTQRGTARGINGANLTEHDLASVVLLAGDKLGVDLEELLTQAANSTDPALDAQSLPILGLLRQQDGKVPGRVLVQGNQVALEGPADLDTELPILSAVLVWGFEDADLSHNQVELRPGPFPYFANALVLARTTQQVGNRLSEPEEDGQRPMCTASLLSFGEAADACGLNVGTHCILAYGGQVADFGNLVLRPAGPCRRG